VKQPYRGRVLAVALAALCVGFAYLVPSETRGVSPPRGDAPLRSARPPAARDVPAVARPEPADPVAQRVTPEVRTVTRPFTSPFLRVFDGIPPDHYTSWKIQYQLQRLEGRTEDAARRAAARRAIARLKEMRETHGPQHAWRTR
jgi:hypothetical protein